MSADEATKTTTEEQQSIVQRLRSNPLIPLIVGVAVAVALLAGIFFWTTAPNYTTLYTGLAPADGSKIVAQLDKMQIPYELAANGSTISVPASAVDKTRLDLAGMGLPDSAGVGFKLMDKQSFGISQFAEHINFMRALQGELARSVETLDAVNSARVHLAIPERSVFVREQAEPSASVVLELQRGRALGEGQVNAIMHLVASSVTRLPLENITVVDARGDLLSDPGKSLNGFNNNELEYIARVERRYRNNIEDILAPIVGRDNIRARVAVNIDFSTGERTEEVYTPNRDGAAVRSEQINLSRDGAGQFIGGVPGALTNRPAADVPSPIVAPDNQDQNANQNANQNGNQNANAAQNAAGTGPGNNADTEPEDVSGSAASSATINYEVNRVIRHIKAETGSVAEISAAVVINYAMRPVKVPATKAQGSANTSQADAEGATKTVTKTKFMPLTDERMRKIESLVKQAIGFSAQRGDSVSVVNAPFQEPQENTGDDTPWWREPRVIALAIDALQWLLLALVALILWFKVIKPLAERVPAFAPEPELAADGPGGLAFSQEDENEEGITEAEAERRRKRREKQTEMIESTQEFAQNDPKLAAMIIKNWMTSDG